MKPLLLAALLTLATVSTSAQNIQINKENKTIAISASADVAAVADIAVVTVGFHTYGKAQDATYADATQISNTIISTLTAAGIPAEAIQSASQRLTSVDPGNEEDKMRYSQGLRFMFGQSWHVTVPADKAANVLHLAILSGANESGNIDWKLEHEDVLQAEAAQKALEHARQIAEHMAEGLNTKLGALVYASNQTPAADIFGYTRGFDRLNTFAALSSVEKRNLKPLAISPERITKSATVYAVFAIQ
jgi:uncharacterized protein YggE